MTVIAPQWRALARQMVEPHAATFAQAVAEASARGVPRDQLDAELERRIKVLRDGCRPVFTAAFIDLMVEMLRASLRDHLHPPSQSVQ